MEKEKKSLLITFHKDNLSIPVTKLLKAAFLFSFAPIIILTIFIIYDAVAWYIALSIALAVFAISIIFVTPYVRNLSALTRYVQELSLDQHAHAPDLTFLNNVGELSEAVERLHWSWENKRNQLEAMIGESKVLVDTLPDVMIMLDEQQNIVRTNKAARNIFGDNVIYKTGLILREKEIRELIELTLEDGQGRKKEISPTEFTAKDFILSVERVPVYSTSGIALIVAMHDISELKLTEKMFADFVANASHEIRTPLTSIVGFIETLNSGAKDDPEARDNFLKIISEQAGRMTKLVKDLLSLSELEMSLKMAPNETIDLNELIENVKTQAGFRGQVKNIVITSHIPEKLPVVTADESQIMQVLENLVNNSIKYGYENSEIKINATVQKNDDTTRGHIASNAEKVVCIEIEDQGEGISAEHLPRLTERFYRVDKARSRKLGGTGLGLAIVKHILNRHQAGLKVSSEVGVGSKFTLILPVV